MPTCAGRELFLKLKTDLKEKRTSVDAEWVCLCETLSENMPALK